MQGKGSAGLLPSCHNHSPSLVILIIAYFLSIYLSNWKEERKIEKRKSAWTSITREKEMT